MVVLRDGAWVKKYRISTSRFGLGDSYGSYKTPLGRLRVWEKFGDALPAGAVLKGREATGEILPVNAPGRDPIVSRILWLEGVESQNDNARGRGIYIHGTPEESNLGKPVSWGCIRMSSADVIELYDIVPVGTPVTIEEDGLPYFAKWKPGSSPVIALQTPPARSVPERLSPVAEILKPSPDRMVRGDVSAATAFRGSILFAGLPTAPKVAPRAPAKAAPRLTLPEEAFRLAAVPVADEPFSLRVAIADPPLGLIDLRRASLTPFLASVSILDAPVPDFASVWESERETIMSALRETSRAMLR
jgi:L,D-transpeptidase catalytic domain